MSDAEMQAVAAEIGYSETAFLAAPRRRRVRRALLRPVAEVPFCGHATIAPAVALAERAGPGPCCSTPGPATCRWRQRAGRRRDGDARSAWRPGSTPRRDELVDAALAALRWSRAELDPDLPPRIAFAGARHLVLGAATRERLARLDYDFDALREAMLATT